MLFSWYYPKKRQLPDEYKVTNRTHFKEANPIYCLLSLLLHFRFTNSKMTICNSHLSTLNTQCMSGMMVTMLWFIYLNFGLCTVCLSFSLTTCYPIVFFMRDTPPLIENEWKALPRWLHLVWLYAPLSFSMLFSALNLTVTVTVLTKEGEQSAVMHSAVK